jgi:hypothetical protein
MMLFAKGWCAEKTPRMVQFLTIIITKAAACALANALAASSKWCRRRGSAWTLLPNATYAMAFAWIVLFAKGVVCGEDPENGSVFD